ncbi:tetratricopeptide repeat protein [Candidatus Woesearchaeota archaeon]|nr:tetratricopeptide repeat protein [Candidatus Woesearchaeota archaeon]
MVEPQKRPLQIRVQPKNKIVLPKRPGAAEPEEPAVEPGKGWEFYNEEGIRYFKEGKYDAAETYFRESIRVDGKHPGVYYNLSATFMKQELYKKAETWVNKGLEIAPEDTQLLAFKQTIDDKFN